MSSLPYLNISHYLIKFGGVVTLITNSVLIYLTVNKIKTIKATYKGLIVLMALLGIMFSLLEMLSSIFTHSYNTSFVFFIASEATGILLSINIFLLSCYSATYMIVICCLAIQFIYRYVVLLSPTRLKWFHGWRISIWLLYGLVCTLFWIFANLKLSPDEYSRKYVSLEMEASYGLDITYLAQYHFVAYNEHGDFRLRNCLGLAFFSAILSFQYMLIVYFGVKTHYGIKAISTGSARTHRMHSQLFKTLVLQITIPSVIYNSPIFLLYIVPYLNLQCSFPSGVMFCFLSLYPAADSLILMWMVTEYRNIFKSEETFKRQSIEFKVAESFGDIAKGFSMKWSNTSAQEDIAGMEMRERV